MAKADLGIRGNGGFGDLDDDGYNLMLTVNSLQARPDSAQKTAIFRSDDFRRFGGVDARSIFAPQGNFLSAQWAANGSVDRAMPARAVFGILPL